MGIIVDMLLEDFFGIKPKENKETIKVRLHPLYCYECGWIMHNTFEHKSGTQVFANGRCFCENKDCVNHGKLIDWPEFEQPVVGKIDKC